MKSSPRLSSTIVSTIIKAHEGYFIKLAKKYQLSFYLNKN